MHRHSYLNQENALTNTTSFKWNNKTNRIFRNDFPWKPYAIYYEMWIKIKLVKPVSHYMWYDSCLIQINSMQENSNCWPYGAKGDMLLWSLNYQLLVHMCMHANYQDIQHLRDVSYLGEFLHHFRSDQWKEERTLILHH